MQDDYPFAVIYQTFWSYSLTSENTPTDVKVSAYRLEARNTTKAKVKNAIFFIIGEFLIITEYVNEGTF